MPTETEQIAIRRRRAKLRCDTFTRYGTCCVKCGESDPIVLTIDHVQQNGAEHRREIGKVKSTKSANRGRYSGYKFYEWLRARGFPDGYRTLCFNCNIRAWAERNWKKWP